MKTTIPWGRVLAEGAIIVVSILLAFAIDAGWESRQEGAWRREALGDLRREAEANQAALSEYILLYETGVAAAERIYSETSALSDLPSDSLARVFALSVFIPTFDPDDAVLTSLVRSGQLDRIEDRALRSAVSRWLDLTEDVAENRRDSEMTRDELFFLLRERRLGREFDILFAPVGEGASDQAGVLSGIEAAASLGIPDGLRTLIGDPQFHELMAHRAMWGRVMLSELRQLRASILEVMALLGSQPG